MIEPVKLDTFDGHLVLYCKGHYVNTKTKTKEKAETDFFEGLKKIWAVRCGYDYKPEGDRVLEYIADHMFEILVDCKALSDPTKIKHFMDVIHKGVYDQNFKPQGMSPIRALIWEYRTMICGLKIKELPKGKKRHVPIVILPKPMKRVFNRILNGKGEYKDYEKITKKDKKDLVESI